MDRVKKTLWSCLGIVAAVGLGMGMLVYAFGGSLMGLYNSDPEVISYGLVRMGIILPTYFICGMMDVMVGQMRGIGFSIMPMVVSLAGACGLRIVWIMTIFAANHTLPVLYASYPVSWGVTFAIHLICYLTASRKKLNPAPAQA
jgi:Na+-driven multidrug efflux pump